MASRLKKTPQVRQALLQAKTLLARARAGDLEAAQVLTDVLTYAGHPRATERLALALAGRMWPSGDRLPADGAARYLKNTLEGIALDLSPPRASPCMPNRRDLWQLVRDAHGDGPEARRWMRDLWKALERACTGPNGLRVGQNWRVVENIFDIANSAVRGHGSENLVVDTARGGRHSFDYVNMGDVYDATLLLDYRAGRFLVSSYGDIVERLERKFGRA